MMREAWRWTRIAAALPFLALGSGLLALGVWLHPDRRGMRAATADLLLGTGWRR